MRLSSSLGPPKLPNASVKAVSPLGAWAAASEHLDVGGGAAIQGDDGQYHMFAALMEGHCGLRSWHNSFPRVNGTQMANSAIIRATAQTPDGPYSLAATILRTFSHGPQVSALPDGRLVLAHLGCGNHTMPEFEGCTNGSTPGISGSVDSPSSRMLRPPGLSNCDWPGWTGVLLQNSSSWKDWKQLAEWSGPGLIVDGGRTPWHINITNSSAHADNPSFWPMPNGTVVLAYASKMRSPSTSKHKHIGVAVGELPIDGGPLLPFRDVSKTPIFPYEAEDPTIWLDTTNNLTDMRWHVFAHRLVSDINNSSNVCAHAVASSPYGPWKVATTAAYNTTIEWVAAEGNSASSTVWIRNQGRERPHVIFSRAGMPVALSTGVTPGRGPTPVTPNGFTGDFSYTHVQLLNPS